MLHTLESQVEEAMVEIPKGGIYKVNAMASIQKVGPKKFPGERNFRNLAHVLQRSVVNLARGNGSNKIRFIGHT